MAKFSIQCKTLDGTFNVPFLEGKTVLESLEAAKIPTNSHCRDGFCGACRCKLTSGEINYTVDPLAFIDEDEILLCCSLAQTDITIDLE